MSDRFSASGQPWELLLPCPIVEQIKEVIGNDALEVFETAMENIMPVLEVRARRVGGSNYQVPVEVRPERRTTLGLRWLVTTL